VDTLLKVTNKTTIWPAYIARPYSKFYDNFIPQKQHMYVIFVWPEREKDINDTLGDQMENLVEHFESFNRRGEFVIVTVGYEKLTSRDYAKDIIEILWKRNKITNALVVIPNKHRYISNSASINVNKTRLSVMFLVYTWSAYESQQCDRVEKTFLIDKWIVRKNVGRFEKNAVHLHSKSPRNLNGCIIRVSAVHFPPSVIMSPKSSDKGDKQYRGVEMEYLFLLSEAMNMTLIFRPPREGEVLEQLTRAFSEVTLEDDSDMAIGFLLLNPVVVSFGDPSIPYLFTDIEWSVPCSKPALRVEKIKSMFSTSVWFLIALVFVLMSLVFWSMSHTPYQAIVIDSNAYMSLLDCLQMAWAILLSLSVPKLPQRNLLRTAFVTYVWYCLAINTVFQSYLISYLTEPGYGTQIRTMQQLNESNLIIYIPNFVKKMMFFTSYETYNKIKLRTEISPNYADSFRRLTNNNDVAMLGLSLLNEYTVATDGRFGNYKEHVCILDDQVATTGISMYFAKGNPLLSSVNGLIRRCFEAGLVHKYTSQLMWKTRLENSPKSRKHENQGSGHIYFKFTLLHMRLAFLVLIVGYALSSFVFFVELVYAVKAHRWG
jgi:hypothetical protein